MALLEKLRAYSKASPPANILSFEQASGQFRRIWESLRSLQQGKMDVSVRISLDQNATSTEFEDVRLTSQSQVILSPLTPTALIVYNAGTGIHSFAADRRDGHWTLRHATSADTNLNFLATIIG